MYEKKFVEDLTFDDSFEKFGFERRRLFRDRNLKFYQPKERDNKIVILPPVYEPELANNKLCWKSFGIVLYRHIGVTPDNDEFPCVKLMLNQKCPFCENYSSIPDPEEKRIYKPQMRGCLWVVDVSSREAEAEGAKLWMFGWAKETFLSFKKAMTDPETHTIHNIFKEPRVFYFDMVERGEGKFKSMQVVAPKLGSRPVDMSKYKRWLEGVKPFMEIINFPTEDELEFFSQQGAEEDVGLPATNYDNYIDEPPDEDFDPEAL